MILTVDGAQLTALLLASVRVATWLIVVPPFSTRGIPSMAKVILALGLSLSMAPTLATEALPSTTPGLLVATASQALIGLAMGYVTMLLFSAIGAAGSLIDLFGGFALASAWDPLGMNMNTVFGRFHQMLATILLMASGGHLLVIGGLLSTFKYLPLNSMPDMSNWDSVLVTAFSMFFTVAVQMALPMIAVLFVADLALALLTKVAPQLNALNVMFPAKVGLTLLLLGLSFPMLPGAVDHLVELANEAMASMAGAA
ncbi:MULTISPECIES: flagellar biosynthetic protein FliR [unclassified Nocardioides]|uniref:flagellar biosynthetic protein FliR n=1 Tax=unclassified Nocardioides TaxID=2615069 RepID=UPI0006F39A2E|nr:MULTISPECIES: flagellar biosynthetic protein FliR [unclassified Nocardioides]KRA31141.1 flagellar biosynthetic protein FliR [Nocardioides sp. Root614]KRA87761.1 flagellar biosynthetic protein FliR [Nocardioides sp. Root682]